MFVSGYTGSQCETYECISAVCPTNSQCVDGINSFSCVCLEGKIGELCDKGWGQYHQVINTWILHLCCINYQNYGKLTCEINVHLLRWVQRSIFLLHLYRFVFFCMSWSWINNHNTKISVEHFLSRCGIYIWLGHRIQHGLWL